MKNKQKFYFILNLAVLLPLLLVSLASLLYTISDYLVVHYSSVQSLWIVWLKDFSLWYVDMILDFTARNNTTRGGMQEIGFGFLILIFQAILSLILIVSGYLFRLLRGATFKILLGIYVVCFLLFFVSIPIRERTSDRILDQIRYDYLDYIPTVPYIYPSKVDECLNKYFVTTDRGINNPRPIELKSGKFTPKDNADDTTLNCFSDMGDYYYGLIQFSDISEVASKEGTAKLADIGIELLNYVYENAFIAKFDKSKMADRRNDILATDIRWFGSFKPEYKDSKLKERTNITPTVKLQAQFFEGISSEDKNITLEILKDKYNATISFTNFNSNSYGDYVGIEVPVDEMQNIAKLSTIQYVSYQPPPPTTD